MTIKKFGRITAEVEDNGDGSTGCWLTLQYRNIKGTTTEYSASLQAAQADGEFTDSRGYTYVLDNFEQDSLKSIEEWAYENGY